MTYAVCYRGKPLRESLQSCLVGCCVGCNKEGSSDVALEGSIIPVSASALAVVPHSAQPNYWNFATIRECGLDDSTYISVKDTGVGKGC